MPSGLMSGKMKFPVLAPVFLLMRLELSNRSLITPPPVRITEPVSIAAFTSCTLVKIPKSGMACSYLVRSQSFSS